MNKKILIFSLSIIAISLTSYMVFGWSEPTTTMPGSYSIPINTSATAQTKAGEIGASSFIDADDPSYYINPSGITKLSGLITAGSGDFNGDGVLNVRDVRDIAWYANGSEEDLEAEDEWNRPITFEDLARADFNGDGRVDYLDADALAWVTVGKDPELEKLKSRKMSDQAYNIDEFGNMTIHNLIFGGNGDVNGDGVTNINDANLVFGYLNGSVTFDKGQIAKADISGDGNVDTLDYQFIADSGSLFWEIDSTIKTTAKTVADKAIDIDKDGHVSVLNVPISANHVATKNYVDSKCILVAYDNVAPAETCPVEYYVSEGTLSTSSGYMMCCHVGNPELIP